MLFISRRFPSQKTSKSIFGEDLIYGVADSDDGVEYRCDAETIINLISDYGIKIEGVDFKKNGAMRAIIDRSAIRVVQCDRWAKAESTKLKMLLGVGLAQFARHFHLVKTFITIESPSMVISLLHLT